MNNKKGMFFTLLVIALLSFFILAYTLSSVSFKQSREPISKRIKTLDNLVYSIEQDIPRQIYISGFRIIFLFEKRIIESGTYIDDTDQRLNELFFNGTLYSENQDLMSGATYNDIKNSLFDKASKINANVTMANPKITIYQEDPWNVIFQFESNLTINDNGGLVSWIKQPIIKVRVSVEGFEDPLYHVSTGGLVANKINQTPYTYFVNGSDINNLLSHVTNSYYIAHNDSPNFLMRIEGNITPDVNGIESLIFLPKLSAQGISLKPKSVVDYIYFSTNDPPKKMVLGMPGWFYLDSGHYNTYGVTNITL